MPCVNETVQELLAWLQTQLVAQQSNQGTGWLQVRPAAPQTCPSTLQQPPLPSATSPAHAEAPASASFSKAIHMHTLCLLTSGPLQKGTCIACMQGAQRDGTCDQQHCRPCRRATNRRTSTWLLSALPLSRVRTSCSSRTCSEGSHSSRSMPVRLSPDASTPAA